ncbi:hypothetical protein [Egicoccus sp. AB-alg2]|uniref:hypothetical protein n=1 Tax=Egicoccus sp. AB-alg2 TaxID=3242693 RepID=UPI00359D4EAD
MSDTDAGTTSLVASFPDGAAARRAIERLSRAGVDGADIRLLGAVEVVAAGRYGDRQTDLGSALAVGRRAVRGVVLGLPPGAVFGLVLLAVYGDPTGWTLCCGAGGGAVFGASLGLTTTLMATPTMVAGWERTFAPLVPGGVAVGVQCRGTTRLARARSALSRSGAQRVTTIDHLDDYPTGPLDVHALDVPAVTGGGGAGER